MNPHNPPAIPASIRATIKCITGGKNVNFIPTKTATNEPNVNCPAAPMLKSPVLKAKPTARPVIIIGTAKFTV